MTIAAQPLTEISASTFTFSITETNYKVHKTVMWTVLKAMVPLLQHNLMEANHGKTEHAEITNVLSSQNVGLSVPFPQLIYYTTL